LKIKASVQRQANVLLHRCLSDPGRGRLTPSGSAAWRKEATPQPAGGIRCHWPRPHPLRSVAQWQRLRAPAVCAAFRARLL